MRKLLLFSLMAISLGSAPAQTPTTQASGSAAAAEVMIDSETYVGGLFSGPGPMGEPFEWRALMCTMTMTGLPEKKYYVFMGAEPDGSGENASRLTMETVVTDRDGKAATTLIAGYPGPNRCPPAAEGWAAVIWVQDTAPFGASLATSSFTWVPFVDRRTKE